MAGADSVIQGEDYLNHTWQPHTDARRFEYSTAHVSQALALRACFDELLNRYGIDAIHSHNQSLRARLLAQLNENFFRAVEFPAVNQSGIVSFILPDSVDPMHFARSAAQRGVVVSSRGGYLRIAPHFCTNVLEIDRATEILNALIET